VRQIASKKKGDQFYNSDFVDWALVNERALSGRSDALKVFLLILQLLKFTALDLMLVFL